jgi:hypothetical protein
LSGRMQRVHINESNSKWLLVSSGVPQGSVELSSGAIVILDIHKRPGL